MSVIKGHVKLSKFVFLTLTISLYIVSYCHFGLAKPGIMDKITSVKSSEDSLYNASDNVVVLNVTTFESAVLGSDQAWLVEFYNRWCGRCIRFSPVWKEFASDVMGWKAAVQIAVIDCVVEANIPLCRNYNIEYFPTIRFFTAHHVRGDYGKPIENMKDIAVPVLRKTLIQLLEEEQSEGRGGAHWPNFSPYTASNLVELWKEIPKSVRFSFLVFQDSSRGVGTDLILDMSRIPEVYMRTVSHDNKILAQLMNVSSLPSVVVISQELNKQEALQTQNRTRNEFRIAIEAFLKLNGIDIPKINNNVSLTMTRLLSSEKNDIQEQVKQLRSHKGDVVFLGDVELALQYSLMHEVSTKKELSGPALLSLQAYLLIIAQHFPLSFHGQQLIQTLINEVDGLMELSGEDWRKRLTHAESSLAAPAWTKRDDFLGCQGSQPKFRGYPCSLWTMFHVLTIHASENPEEGGPRSVLEAILGYVTHFFGCTECSQHFQSMAAEKTFSEVTSHNDSALWLWEAHNKVNQRLAGDATEDPEFPKIQFPAVNHCPGCHDGDAWVKNNVLLYLQSIYSHKSLSALGSSTLETTGKEIGNATSSTARRAISLRFPTLMVVVSLIFLSW